MLKRGTNFYMFGGFRFDPQAKVLTHDGQIVPLPYKAQQVLAVLLARRGEVISKDELLGEVWKDVFVEEGNLSVHVHTLRKSLARLDPAHQPYIQTVKRYGFRFVPEVREVATDGSNSVFGSRGQPGVPETIAVMPFSSSQPGGEEFLTTGLADVLTAKLNNTGRFIVRPADEMAEYAGWDVERIGHRLTVSAVLKGDVQRRDDRLRVTVQLTGTEEGVTLWAEEFDEKLTNIFDVEDLISEHIVEALELKLSQNEKRRLLKHYTENTEAHFDYLKGRFFWNKRTPHAIRNAIKYFERAIEKDPGFALAYTGLADSYNHLGHHGAMPAAEVRSKMKSAILKSLELDDAVAETHASLAAVLMDYEWDWQGAEGGLRRAIEINPNYAPAHHWYAELLTMTGRHEAAVAEIKRARALDPLSLIINAEVGRQLYFEREYAGAIQELLDAKEMDIGFPWTNLYLMQAYAEVGNYQSAVALYTEAVRLYGGSPLLLATLGYVYALAGDTGKARDVLTKLNELTLQITVSPTYIAFIHNALGETTAALKRLEKAYAEHNDPHLQFLKVYPQFDVLRADLRFQALMKKMGL